MTEEGRKRERKEEKKKGGGRGRAIMTLRTVS